MSNRLKGKARKEAREQQAALEADRSRSETPVQSNTDVPPNSYQSSVASSAQPSRPQPGHPASFAARDSQAQPTLATRGPSAATAPIYDSYSPPNPIRVALGRLRQLSAHNASPLLSRLAVFIRVDEERSRIRRHQSTKEIQRVARTRQKVNNMTNSQIKQNNQLIKELQDIRLEGGNEEADRGNQAYVTAEHNSAHFENVTVDLVIPRRTRKDLSKRARAKKNHSKSREKRKRGEMKVRLDDAASAGASSSATGPKDKKAAPKVGSEDSYDDIDLVSSFLPFVMACQKATEHRIRNQLTEGARQIRDLLQEAQKPQRDRQTKPQLSSETIYEFIDTVLALPYILEHYSYTRMQISQQSSLSKKANSASIFPDLRANNPDPYYTDVATLSCDSLTAVFEVILTLPPSVTGFKAEKFMVESLLSTGRIRYDRTLLSEGDLNLTYMLLAYGWPSINV